MILALPTLLTLAQACAPSVAPETLLSVAKAESGFDPLVVSVNGARPAVYRPATAAAAATLAEGLLARGANLDLGLAQINSRNLRRLGLTLQAAFDPCRNLAAGGRVLAEGYRRASARQPEPKAALAGALSAYNTGDLRRGQANGYVARVQRAAAVVVPAIAAPSARVPDAPAKPSKAMPSPPWDVFAAPRAPALIF